MDPRLSSKNVPYGRLRNSESISQTLVGRSAGQRSDLTHLVIRKLGIGTSLSPEMGAVDFFVRRVFGWRGPSDVRWVNAAWVAAYVRGFMGRGWRATVHNLTNRAMSAVLWMSGTLDLPVAFSGLAVWPQQAVGPAKIDRHFGQEFEEHLIGPHLCQRCPVSLPTRVVCNAPASQPCRALASVNAARLNGAFAFRGKRKRVTVEPFPTIVGLAPSGSVTRLAAAWNRAYALNSHLDLLLGWAGQNPSRRSNARRVRYLYQAIGSRSNGDAT